MIEGERTKKDDQAETKLGGGMERDRGREEAVRGTGVHLPPFSCSTQS